MIHSSVNVPSGQSQIVQMANCVLCVFCLKLTNWKGMHSGCLTLGMAYCKTLGTAPKCSIPTAWIFPSRTL